MCFGNGLSLRIVRAAVGSHKNSVAEGHEPNNRTLDDRYLFTFPATAARTWFVAAKLRRYQKGRQKFENIATAGARQIQRDSRQVTRLKPAIPSGIYR